MSWEVRVGDALERLLEMPDESVHMVCTSPPYWGLRDYGTAEWGGGDPGCDHLQRTGGTASSTLGVMSGGNATNESGAMRSIERSFVPFAGECGKCGARRVDQQLGLEPTPDEFVARLVVVFREVRRVLRSDGVCWLNIGDCYATGAGAVGDSPGGGEQGKRWKERGRMTQPNRMPIEGLKPKDLVMVPARLALALQADGWWVRSDVIWSKPNPMPESIEDRPTQAHEHVFMLTKARRYFYDAFAIRETDKGQDHAHRNELDGQPSLEPSNGLRSAHGGLRTAKGRNGSGRNRRNVWEVATAPFTDAHFATFPPKLVEPCVLAGASPHVCGVCGAPWHRLTDREYVNPGNRTTNGPRSIDREHELYGSAGFGVRMEAQVREIGWQAGCRHLDAGGSAVVLDPFAGSGTVGVVCEWLGRDFIGIELNPEYAEMARVRITSEGRLGRRAYRPQRRDDDQLALEVT